VLLYHAWQFAGGPKLVLGPLDLTPLAACGFFGVDLFFVLSGYLLGLPFIRARMAAAPQPSLRRFWQRRCRRVLPAYWTQLVILLAIATVAAGGVMPLGAGELVAHAGLLFNLVDNTSPLNAVYWSLPVEWDFYLVLPLLALGFSRGRGWPWLLPLALLAAIGFRVACGWALLTYGADGIGFYRWVMQLPARLDQFAFGMTAAWLTLRGLSTLQRQALAVTGIAIVLLQAWMTAPRGDFLGNADLAWVYWHYSALGAGFAAIIAAAAVPGSGPARLFDGRVLGFFGLISYSLYLWHYPVLQALRALATSVDARLLWWLLAPALAIVVSTLSYVLVERPFLQPRRGGTSIPAASAP
jgi:peptidoglycan/LPS O-acetylase OafA/YrhL